MTTSSLYNLALSQLVFVILKVMMPNNKLVPIAKADKKEFKVKFANNHSRKRPPPGKELILGERGRERRNNRANGAVSTPDIHSELVESNESESQANSSKRELKVEPKVEKINTVPYTNTMSSAIVPNFQFLNGFFGQGNEVSLKLIYRASNHRFSVRAFHELCDAYEDTLVLCLTQDSKIIGGYTPLCWEDEFHKKSTHFKTDFKRQTFLFSVSDRQKYPLVKSLKNKAICCFKAYGPTFGGGYDLLIGDKTDQQPNTTSYFPRNFQYPTGVPFNKRDFTGTSRKNFKLIEWEVFHVIKMSSFHTMETLNFNQPNPLEERRNERSMWERFKTTAKEIIKALCSDS